MGMSIIGSGVTVFSPHIATLERCEESSAARVFQRVHYIRESVCRYKVISSRSNNIRIQGIVIGR
ncbi:hypothetical protein Barb7_02171 [Bacteroidales bacterium Barb7]|nr:hypothetical protein Barb7_02171 [Bacteroidales bacterium Barb7]